MRVLHVIDNLDPGGTEQQCVELVRGLCRVGVRNAVFYFRAGSLLGTLERLDITLRAVPLASRTVWLPVELMSLARAIGQWRPDVVQTYGFQSNVPGILAAFLARVPVRIAGRRWYRDYLSPVNYRVDRAVWRLAHRIVANSHAIRRHLVVVDRVAPDRVAVIRNGVDAESWLPVEPVEPTAEPRVGMIAHFRPGKDHSTFVRAAGLVRKVIPSARFCLLGSGPTEASVRACASALGINGQLEFRGQLRGQAFRAAVKQLSVSVLASMSEGLPNAVIESMAAARPVVATSVGGTPELVEDGVTGFLVPPEDPEALADRVIRLLANPSLARSMGERGRQKIERELTVERMVTQFHELYRHLLRERRR